MIGLFLFDTASRPALGPIQPPIQRLPGDLFLWVKRPGCEADHSPPSIAEIKKAWSCPSTPQYVSVESCLNKRYVLMAWCLVKHRDSFTFSFTFSGSPPPHHQQGTRMWLCNLFQCRAEKSVPWRCVSVLFSFAITKASVRNMKSRPYIRNYYKFNRVVQREILKMQGVQGAEDSSRGLVVCSL
jgi:hypothetical protein